MRKIGCLVVLLCFGILAWLVRDRWMPYLDRFRDRDTTSAPVDGPVWEPLTEAGAARAREQIASLESPRGPVFVNIRPGDVAAHLLQSLARVLPPNAEDARAAVIGDQIHVKAYVRLADFGGASALGALAGLLADRDTVQLGGRFEVLRPGLAQFRVTTVRIGQLDIPARIIPRLVRQMGRGMRPEGLADDALPLVVPPYIADVRAARGRLTLYRNTP